jgi:hypothetical protein
MPELIEYSQLDGYNAFVKNAYMAVEKIFFSK